MSSYGDEDYTYRPTSSTPSTPKPFFKPTPAPAPKTSKTAGSSIGSSTSTGTKKAASVAPPVTTVVKRPNGIINIIVAFDTSSSMGIYRKNVREKTEYLRDEIVKVIPELGGKDKFEIAFVGVSDHCDGPKLLQPTGFSGESDILRDHIMSIKDAYGGDGPEAYECLFKLANTWDIEGTNTIMVLVGDSVPHGMGIRGISDDGCPVGVDWEKELLELKKKLKGFYLISCADENVVKKYQKKLVDDEEHFIELGNNFSRLTNVVHGIVAKELGSIDEYLKHLKTTRGATRAEEVETLLKTKTK